MGLGIRVREREHVTIVDFDGRVVLGDGTEDVTETVRKLLGEGRRKLLLNLAGVDKMDSTGIGALVGGYVSAHRKNGSLKLLKPRSRIKHPLDITRLTTVFEIFDDEDTAIGSFDS